MKVKADQYNGPTFFLDNRLGTTSKQFYISAYIKADDTSYLYNTVSMWGGNKYENSSYVSGMYATTAARRLSADWEQIKGVCIVAAGKFTEIRIKSDTANYDIDHLVIKILEDSDDTTMAPDPVEPAPDTSLTETFTINQADMVVTKGWGYTKNNDGTYTLADGWRYMLITLPDYVDMSKFSGVELVGTISNKYRVSVFDKYETNLLGDNQYVYMDSGITTRATVGLSTSGYAKYLCIGSCSAGEELNVDLSSITFNQKPNTDGVTETSKEVGSHNPISTQRFTADPYAINYNGTVYVYGTNDSEQLVPNGVNEYEENDFSMIKSLNCYSSKDMVNWTDEGTIQVGGSEGASTWASNSWAPAVCYKNIDGKDKFFLYYANSANNIGVLTSDSPTGPWTDPLGKALIDRTTPNCSADEVTWLFDPAVLVDTDGTGYLYFGGGYADGDEALPGTERVVKLKDDMIHLDGDPVQIDAPYAFEDSGINKIGDTYYYSYCTNFSTAAQNSDYGAGTIVYMTSKDPMKGFTLAGKMLDNPGKFFSGATGNNHHCMLSIGDDLYMFYHTMQTSVAMGLPKGYRSTSVDSVSFENNTFDIKMTETGVDAIADFDPFALTEAETFAFSVGTSTLAGPTQDTRMNRVLSSISDGDYVGIENANFGDIGATSVTMSIVGAASSGSISVYIDDMTNENLVGTIPITQRASDDVYTNISADLTKTITGKHRIFFVFNTSDLLVDTWKFIK